jgi:hypothetical protein
LVKDFLFLFFRFMVVASTTLQLAADTEEAKMQAFSFSTADDEQGRHHPLHLLLENKQANQRF